MWRFKTKPVKPEPSAGGIGSLQTPLPARRAIIVAPGRQPAADIVALVAAGAAFFGAIWAAAADTIHAKEQLCASCHGARGLPADHTVPIIWGQQTPYLKQQLTDYQNGDRDNQIMSSIAESLTEPEIAEISADFGHAKWPDQAPAPPPGIPAAIAICKTCHHPDLTGGMSPSGIAPRLAGQFSGYLVDTMTAYANGERADSTPMPELMKSLSAADRTAIADYLGALR